MANILYLVHKMRFDFSFGMYLGKWHDVIFMTSDPMIGLFLDTQHAEAVHLYEVEPVQSRKLNSLKVQQTLSQTHFYRLTDNKKVKHAFYDLCTGYLRFLEDYIVSNKIDLIVTQTKNFLDSACVTTVANECNLPICYLGAGFFRGESCGVFFEPLRVFEPAIWQNRWAHATHRSFVPTIKMPNLFFEPIKLKKPGRLLSLWQKARYQRNPLWVSRHPDLRPTRSLLKDLKHQSLKSSGKNLPDQSSVLLPDEFILLPLQGNEICGEVPNPLGISDMEYLTSVTEAALIKLNKNKRKDLKLVVKEHPARPGIISSTYKKQHPEILFLYKYPMPKLLDKTQLVVTFNSLTGFEALQQYKPVVTFGPLFYTLPALVYECRDLNLLPDLMDTAISNGCDRAAVDDFILFLKKHFDVPCPGFSRKNPTKEMFQKIHAKIEGVLEFSKHHSASPNVWTPGEENS